VVGVSNPEPVPVIEGVKVCVMVLVGVFVTNPVLVVVREGLVVRVCVRVKEGLAVHEEVIEVEGVCVELIVFEGLIV